MKKDDKKETTTNAIAPIVKQAYDELISPSAKPTGKILSLIPRTIRLFFAKWEKWIVNCEKSLELTLEAMAEKTENIPEEKLTEPEPYVAIPAIQQLSYSFDSEILREMYANLLVSSMNVDTKELVHPAYVDIIKQLSPDEAKLLRFISEEQELPLIQVNMKTNDIGFKVAVKNYTNIAEKICENPDGIFTYLDNLERLQFIKIYETQYLADESYYQDLEKNKDILELLDEIKKRNAKAEIKRKLFSITDFGKDFTKICLG